MTLKPALQHLNCSPNMELQIMLLLLVLERRKRAPGQYTTPNTPSTMSLVVTRSISWQMYTQYRNAHCHV